MTVTLTLPPDAERVLRERAARAGMTLADYLGQLAAREAATPQPLPAEGDFEATLDQLAALGGTAPVPEGKLNRAELYADHD